VLAKEKAAAKVDVTLRPAECTQIDEFVMMLLSD